MNSEWPKVMLLSAATSPWLLYEIATATRAAWLMRAFRQYSLLACALLAPGGSAVMRATEL